jgi:hypothetical protein
LIYYLSTQGIPYQSIGPEYIIHRPSRNIKYFNNLDLINGLFNKIYENGHVVDLRYIIIPNYFIDNISDKILVYRIEKDFFKYVYQITKDIFDDKYIKNNEDINNRSFFKNSIKPSKQESKAFLEWGNTMKNNLIEDHRKEIDESEERYFSRYLRWK